LLNHHFNLACFFYFSNFGFSILVEWKASSLCIGFLLRDHAVEPAPPQAKETKRTDEPNVSVLELQHGLRKKAIDGLPLKSEAEIRSSRASWAESDSSSVKFGGLGSLPILWHTNLVSSSSQSSGLSETEYIPVRLVRKETLTVSKTPVVLFVFALENPSLEVHAVPGTHFLIQAVIRGKACVFLSFFLSPIKKGFGFSSNGFLSFRIYRK
jgi:hypothetical protein